MQQLEDNFILYLFYDPHFVDHAYLFTVKKCSSGSHLEVEGPSLLGSQARFLWTKNCTIIAEACLICRVNTSHAVLPRSIDLQPVLL